MTTQIHALVVAAQTESRIQAAADMRLARELRRQRRDARRSRPDRLRLHGRVTARA
jgi:hypothetical protein